MSDTTLKTALGTTLALSLAGSGAAAAATNPFAMAEVQGPAVELAEGKCGGQKSTTKAEGKCGEGRCGGAAKMSQADVDGDGRVTRGEYLEWAKEEARRRFEAMDINDDGAVDRAEMETYGDR